ncbi:hypothetical protein QQ045_032125 [Rhodiola kirilowii]
MGSFYLTKQLSKRALLIFFKDLFNGSFIFNPADPHIIRSSPIVSAADCINLVKDFSYNEVAEVVKQPPSCKVADPDGFNVEFFRAAWSDCGADVVESINNFFKGINSAYLALILKVKNASLPSDIRPISCCNVLYKIISTLLANRLNLFKIISLINRKLRL